MKRIKRKEYEAHGQLERLKVKTGQSIGNQMMSGNGGQTRGACKTSSLETPVSGLVVTGETGTR